MATKALDPGATHTAVYSGRLTTAPTGTWRGTDLLGPVYFAPTYPQPTFDPLIKLSKDWIIPGLDQVPPNTVCLLESNERFIEAYMAGLNFELGRELVWNGIPTDQRGSYFRQFWDHSTALTPSMQPVADDARYDIDVLTDWKTHALGKNPNPNGLPAGALFLLLRGDLLHRYPNALLYATKAVSTGGTRVFPDLTRARRPGKNIRCSARRFRATSRSSRSICPTARPTVMRMMRRSRAGTRAAGARRRAALRFRGGVAVGFRQVDHRLGSRKLGQLRD